MSKISSSNKFINLSLVAICTLSLNLNASETNLELDTVEVTDSFDDVKNKKVGETIKDAKKLSKEQVSDIKDMVKYETGVTVVESGRFGTSGYAIRGVDENRVAITIDGLHQAETLSSQGFKEIFEGYGNFNNTRNSIEVETIKQVTIAKGANSMKTGSGSLGGSVMFETKDARDFLIEKDYFLGFKSGYQSRNSESVRSLTTAFRYKWFDFLYINTKRSANETENYFYDIYGPQEDRTNVGREREKADPYTISKNSNLIKIGFSPSEEHRFSFAIDDSSLNSKGEDLSYVFRSSQFVNKEVFGERKNDDKSKRRSISYTYENFVTTPFWDNFKIRFSKQKIKNNARTDEFCDGENCEYVLNPQGLNYTDKNGVLTLVDKNGDELRAVTEANPYSAGNFRFKHFQNSAGETLVQNKDYNNYRRYPVDRIFINCDIFDCSKKIKVFKEERELGYVNGKYSRESVFNFVERDIVTKYHNGKKYGEVKREQDDFRYDFVTSTNVPETEKLYFITPGTAGYQTNYYNDRDLNTDTNQFNLDFEKEFDIFHTTHELKYGALYSIAKKSMVNKDGYAAANTHWWADGFYNSTRSGGKYDPNFNSFTTTTFPRNSDGKHSTYLIPVKTKTGALYIGDKFEVTDWFGLDLGYRYDKVLHKPFYDRSVAIPKGLLVGIFMPTPHATITGAGCAHGTPCFEKNFEDNLNILLQNKKYSQSSYSAGFNFDPLSYLKLQLKFAKAFRAPTSDEIYMTFKHPNFSIRPNINLNAETAKTKELALTLHNGKDFITLSGFKSNYDNFIDMAYYGRVAVVDSAIPYPFYGSVNRDKAYVKGFEINSNLDLKNLAPYLDGLSVGYKLTHQVGKITNEEGKEVPMNAIQPTTHVLRLSFDRPKYGLDVYLTRVAEKKAEDTYNQYYKELMADNRIIRGKLVTDDRLAWRSNTYTLLDMILRYTPIKNVNISFGVYNITNAKYLTWDSARSIRVFGTTNLIDQNTGKGIGRFYAPKRNFKLTWEIKF